MAEPLKTISWQALEHNHGEKTTDWYWIVGIVAVGGAVLAIFFDNMLFGLIILLAGFLSIMQARTPARVATFEISRKGIRQDNIAYPFGDLESFWVIDEEVNDQIILKSKRALVPYIIIPFDSTKTDPEEIRDFLLDYIDEEEMYEPLFNKVMEMIGF